MTLALVLGCAQTKPLTGLRESEARRPPNLIIVMTDDQGHGDWQAHDPRIHTPNMLSLADEGFVFDNYHAMVACSPTRAALLTGRDGRRTGVTGLMNHNDRDHRFMALGELTLAELLQQRGYRTALIGK
jgi:arylsulfatase A-like enzyme